MVIGALVRWLAVPVADSKITRFPRRISTTPEKSLLSMKSFSPAVSMR
jgi:hypothetical protein